jgi:hypothetical protein
VKKWNFWWKTWAGRRAGKGQKEEKEKRGAKDCVLPQNKDAFQKTMAKNIAFACALG